MELNLELIRSYNFEEYTSKPDWDDVQVTFELPNGIELSCLTVCGNEPTKADCLEGLDGYIYIESKEELDELVKLTYEEVILKIESENGEFNAKDYLEF